MEVYHIERNYDFSVKAVMQNMESYQKFVLHRLANIPITLTTFKAHLYYPITNTQPLLISKFKISNYNWSKSNAQSLSF